MERLSYVRNLNKRRGYPFYVIFDKENKFPNLKWLGQIEYSKKKKRYVLATVNKIEFDILDLIEITKFIESIDKEGKSKYGS